MGLLLSSPGSATAICLKGKISNSLTYEPDSISMALCDVLQLTHFPLRGFGEEIFDIVPVKRLQLHDLILCNKGTLEREPILIYVITVSNSLSYFPFILFDLDSRNTLLQDNSAIVYPKEYKSAATAK